MKHPHVTGPIHDAVPAGTACVGRGERREENRMGKLVLAIAIFACALSFPAAASTAAPTTITTTGSGTVDFPAGALCDFTYHQDYAFVLTRTFFSDGRVHSRFDYTLTHTNVDTGYTLTEGDHYAFLDITDVQYRNVGLFWHLRDPSGKLVVVHAGTVWFDSAFAVVKITPNAGGNLAAVACPALGGHPA
jgi:hypothetical protein